MTNLPPFGLNPTGLRVQLTGTATAQPAVTTGTVSGEVFQDINGSGKLDAGETGLSGWIATRRREQQCPIRPRRNLHDHQQCR